MELVLVPPQVQTSSYATDIAIYCSTITENRRSIATVGAWFSRTKGGSTEPPEPSLRTGLNHAMHCIVHMPWYAICTMKCKAKHVPINHNQWRCSHSPKMLSIHIVIELMYSELRYHPLSCCKAFNTI